MGRMPREVPEQDCSLPDSGEAAAVVGMGIKEDSQCRQDFGVMPDPLCGPGITPEEGACVGPQGWDGAYSHPQHGDMGTAQLPLGIGLGIDPSRKSPQKRRRAPGQLGAPVSTVSN